MTDEGFQEDGRPKTEDGTSGDSPFIFNHNLE